MQPTLFTEPQAAQDRDECPCCQELAVLAPHGFCSDWCRAERGQDQTMYGPCQDEGDGPRRP